MSEFRQLLIGATLLLITAIVGGNAPLQAQSQPMRWNGTDLIVELPEGATVEQDLAASDSATYIYRISGVTLQELPTNAVVGPEGRRASLQSVDQQLQLVIRGENRFGSTALIRPYSGKLYVHTFRWQDLEYADEQYHKGLIALDENLEDQAVEYLQSAHSFGERRAASVLGAIYLQRGQDSLAAEYLRAPIDADDYMARAEARLGMGDTAGYQADSLNYANEGEVSLGFEVPRDTSADRSEDVVVSSGGFFDDWRGYALIILGSLVVILLVLWFARSPEPEKAEPIEDHHHHHPPAPSPGRTDTDDVPPAVNSTDAPAAAAEGRSTPPPIPDHTRIESQTPAAETPGSAIASSGASSRDVYEKSSSSDPAETVPATNPDDEHRASRQARELRNRMNRNLSEEGTSAESDESGAKAEASAASSSVDQAREMNVSRDYVDLKEKIARLRKKIDPDDPGESR